MKFLIIHNRYSNPGGEEKVVEAQCEILRKAGHSVVLYVRDYAETQMWLTRQVGAAFAALWNPEAVHSLAQLVRNTRPDVAIVHNLFPIISAAILPMLKNEGVKVAMTLHNYRLLCPNGLFFAHGQICERCAKNKITKELNCLLHNCQNSIAQSGALALRGIWSGSVMNYFKHVDIFLPLTNFQWSKITEYKFKNHKYHILPNAINPSAMPESDASQGDYVAFVGRLSPEKGIDTLIEAAIKLPHIEFRIAGAGTSADMTLPDNVKLVGFLNRQQLADFYTSSRMVLITSKCYDNFPLSLIEAMYYERCVVVANIAALPEIIEHGRCGRIFQNVDDLCSIVESLHASPSECATLGRNAKERVLSTYSPDKYYQELIKAIESI